VTYVELDQVDVQSFTLPMIRPTNRLQGKTFEHAIELPQVAYVDVPQARPTQETLIAIPQIRYTIVKQIPQTKEHEIHIPILHYTQIAIIGSIHIDQQLTIVERISITQEWEIEEGCQSTKTHFLQMPQKGVGIRGTVISEDRHSLLPPGWDDLPVANIGSGNQYSDQEPLEIHHVSFKRCDCGPNAL
jgi:hypothetical protein